MVNLVASGHVRHRSIEHGFRQLSFTGRPRRRGTAEASCVVDICVPRTASVTLAVLMRFSVVFFFFISLANSFLCLSPSGLETACASIFYHVYLKNLVAKWDILPPPPRPPSLCGGGCYRHNHGTWCSTGGGKETRGTVSHSFTLFFSLPEWKMRAVAAGLRHIKSSTKPSSTLEGERKSRKSGGDAQSRKHMLCMNSSSPKPSQLNN